MIVKRELLALSDIANLCNTSKNNVSNWRRRWEDFPKPYQETSAGPIWKADGIVPYLNEKLNIDIVATGNLETRRMAVIGRARTGKSFFVSCFVKEKESFTEFFCGGGADSTLCPVNVQISESILLERVEFHTDFNEIYRDCEDEKASSLREKVKIMQGSLYEFHDEAKKCIKKIITDIKEFEKKKREEQGKKKTYKRVSMSIVTYLKPSDFCRELMEKCELGSLQIVDTPGVSGKVEPEGIEKSDLYVFVMRDENEDDQKTLLNIVKKIKPDVATSKVAFLYKTEQTVENKKTFEQASTKVKKNMEVFNYLFAELKDSIVTTDLDLLNPSQHCLPFPSMNEAVVTESEKLLMNALEPKLLDAFGSEDAKKEEEIIKKIFFEQGEEATKLTLKILKGIPCHELYDGKKEYDPGRIKEEHHNRVMTKDNYKFVNDLWYAYREENKCLHDYFSGFQETEYPEEWQQRIIKFIYKMLTQSVRKDRGLGVGYHPFEERPARTMLVEESIVADKILEYLDNREQFRSKTEAYIEALKESGIESSTWGYVACTDDEDESFKLKIVKKYLCGIKVSSRKNLVLCRYVGGLRKIAEFKILKLMGKDEKEAMDIVGELPF